MSYLVRTDMTNFKINATNFSESSNMVIFYNKNGAAIAGFPSGKVKEILHTSALEAADDAN